MINISIKKLMEGSPALAPKIKPHGNKDVVTKENLFACSTSNRKTVIEKTVFKMTNDHFFCDEALKNNFFEDFLASTKREGKTVNFKSLMSKEYEWSYGTVVIFWSIMICHRYFDWTKISSLKKDKEKVTIDSVLTHVMGNREIIEKNTEVGVPYPFTKVVLVDYPYNQMREALEEVEEKVKIVARFIVENGKGRRVNWFDFLQEKIFLKAFNTASVKNYENPLFDYLKQQDYKEESEDMDMIMQRISQIFYPKVDSDFKFESLKKINKKYREEVMLNSGELEDGIEHLKYIKDEFKNWDTTKLLELEELLNSIMKL